MLDAQRYDSFFNSYTRAFNFGSEMCEYVCMLYCNVCVCAGVQVCVCVCVSVRMCVRLCVCVCRTPHLYTTGNIAPGRT